MNGIIDVISNYTIRVDFQSSSSAITKFRLFP